MSEAYNIGRPRFSRRQVTKRKFNILESPSVLQNVHMHKNKSKTEESSKRNKTTRSTSRLDDDNNNNNRTGNKGTDSDNSADLENNNVEVGNNQTDRGNNSTARTDTSRSKKQKQILSSKKDATQLPPSGRKPPNDNSPLLRHGTGNLELNDNEDVEEEEISSPVRHRNKVRRDVSTPEFQPRMELDVGTPTPGDVSVSFLASTPKPGRPQLSRRRPISPVREDIEASVGATRVSVGKASVSTTSVTLDTDLNKNKTKEHSVTLKSQTKQSKLNSSKKVLPQQQQHTPVKSPGKVLQGQKHTPQKSPGRRGPGNSIDELIASSNRARVENKKRHFESSRNYSVSNKSKSADNTGTSLTEDTSDTRSSVKRQKVSVPEHDIPISKNRSRLQEETATEKSLHNLSERKIQSGKTDTRSSTKKTGLTRLQRKDNASVSSRRQSNSSLSSGDEVESLTPSRNRSKVSRVYGENRKSGVNKSQNLGGKNVFLQNLREYTSTDDSDVTVGNSSKRLTLSHQRKKSAVNRHLQNLQKQHESEISPTDQTLVMWEKEGQKRTRSDVVDLDVVLNTVSETLEARLDVYDTDEEQSAVHILEKYISQDITHMINGVQTVADLQSKIKKCHQSIKQKQKSLMSLQKERVKQEMKYQPLKRASEKNERMKTINQFLTDLGSLIDKC